MDIAVTAIYLMTTDGPFSQFMVHAMVLNNGDQQTQDDIIPRDEQQQQQRRQPQDQEQQDGLTHEKFIMNRMMQEDETV